MTGLTRGHRPRLSAALLVATFLSAGCAGPAQPAAPPWPWWAAYQKPGALQTAALGGVPGSKANRCVAVGHHRDVRSGDFLAGPFGTDEQGFTTGYQQHARPSAVKIYWAPLHVDHMSPLTVQASLAGGPTITRSYTLLGATRAFVFYSSGVPIPKPGTWKLHALAGQNKGCFIVSFHA